ncbi:MAG: hypothetical protein RLZZ561_732 [Pseudomonadota bacterium]|jgi:tight adherence protein B
MISGTTLTAIILGSLGLAIILATELLYRIHTRRVSRRRDATFAAHKDIYRKTSVIASFESLDRYWQMAGDMLLAPPMWPRRTSEKTLILIGLVGGLATGLTFYFILSLPGIAAIIVAPVVMIILPRILDREAQNRETDKFVEVLPDAVDMLVRMLRAGLPLSSAVSRVGEEASFPASAVFTEVAEWLDVGVPLGDAFLLVNNRLKQNDFEFFGVSLSVQNTSGGNLTDTLDSLSMIIRERILSGLKARSVSAEARMTANIITSLPVLLFVGIQVIAPGYLLPLVDGRNGYGLITYALASFALGVFVIRNMINRLNVG